MEEINEIVIDKNVNNFRKKVILCSWGEIQRKVWDFTDSLNGKGNKSERAEG